MIFNEVFDKSLWLLIASFKKDSREICRLINFLPKKVYLEIQKNISDYYDLSGKIKQNIVYDNNLNNIDGYDYYILIKIISDKLCFKLCRWTNGNECVEEEYNLILKEIYSDYLANMEFGDVKGIAKYTHEINNIKIEECIKIDTENYSRVYNLNKLPFGFMITSFKKGIPVRRKYVNVLENMPEEINLNDFRSKKNIKRLIKNKNKN